MAVISLLGDSLSMAVIALLGDNLSLLHSSGFTHASQIDISPLQSITHLRHHHSSCTVCLRAQYRGPILLVLYTTLFSNSIASHSVNHQLFADDTQLQKRNDDKTEALLFPFSSSLKPTTISLPDSITLGSHSIPFSDSTGNLGFILDSKLSMKMHVIKICQTAYFELKPLVRYAGFSLKTQPRLLLLPVSSHGLTTAAVASWVHQILSSSLSTKSKTLLQDSFSWHPATNIHTSPGTSALASHFRT